MRHSKRRHILGVSQRRRGNIDLGWNDGECGGGAQQRRDGADQSWQDSHVNLLQKLTRSVGILMVVVG